MYYTTNNKLIKNIKITFTSDFETILLSSLAE
jgi:hypothetical protein